MKTTTLNKIRDCSPCAPGWAQLLKNLGKTAADDEPLTFATILESNGLDDALWCCQSAPEYNREWRLFAVWCARQVQHLMLDPRSIAAIDVAERYANGVATDAELAAARVMARVAAWATPEKEVTARAAREAVRSAAWDAAAEDDGEIARAAAWAEMAGAAVTEQYTKFREIISGEAA